VNDFMDLWRRKGGRRTEEGVQRRMDWQEQLQHWEGPNIEIIDQHLSI
jgi:hypothetical protein